MNFTHLQQAIQDSSATNDNKLKAYCKLFVKMVAKNQEGLCHTNSALLYCFLKELGYDVEWLVGYFETFTNFETYCDHHSDDFAPKKSWHSWLEIREEGKTKGKILDIPIHNQQNHHGFPIVFLNEVLHQNLSLNSYREIILNGDPKIAQYHYCYPKKFRLKTEKYITDVILKEHSPYAQLDNRDMKGLNKNWELKFINGMNKTFGLKLKNNLFKSFTDFVCKRNYISRYHLSIDNQISDDENIQKAIDYLDSQYNCSRINKIVIIIPDDVEVEGNFTSSFFNDILITSTSNVSSILQINSIESPYDNVAYIVFKEFENNNKLRFKLEKIPTTRIIMAIQTKPLDGFQ